MISPPPSSSSTDYMSVRIFNMLNKFGVYLFSRFLGFEFMSPRRCLWSGIQCGHMMNENENKTLLIVILFVLDPINTHSSGVLGLRVKKERKSRRRHRSNMFDTWSPNQPQTHILPYCVSWSYFQFSEINHQSLAIHRQWTGRLGDNFMLVDWYRICYVPNCFIEGIPQLC